jgi:TatD DNase family protein
MNLIDTHCHLNFKAFDADFLEVAKRSNDRGVSKVIIVGSDPKTSLEALERAKKINKLQPDFAFCAIGIHPIHTDRINFAIIEDLAADPLVVAIGETGLDFYHDKERITEKEQVKLFKQHIELALKFNKPLIIHNRQADEKVREIMDQYSQIDKAVLHCFGADHYMAAWAVQKGFYLSFTGNITYGNKKIKKAIERTPIERIMVETDAPYNIPEPLRSEGVNICEPYMTKNVLEKIALIKNMDVAQLSDRVFLNSKDFFTI